MKDYIMSKKNDRHIHKRSDTDSKESDDPYRYKNVLKERHYKECFEEGNKKKDKDKNVDSKHSSHSHKSKKSHSPHRHSHHKSSVDEKSKKHHDNEVSESYEELARRKRKLESELHALDLEEAAEREAENKKARREKPKDNRKYAPEVKIKEHSSDEDRKPPRNKSEISLVKSEKDTHKSHSSKSYADERGWGKPQQDSKSVNKEKPNFAVSGKLAEDTNTYNGIVIRYNEPAEARKPKRRWRLYPFKGDSDLPFIPIHRQSAYLFGRTRLIADIPIDHPSCSKQHAVLQFRLVPYKREDGTTGKRVRPYIIDLESSNGTFVNNKKIDPRCYVELMEKDVIKFGFSSREYVLLHEESKNDDDDDVLETND